MGKEAEEEPRGRSVAIHRNIERARDSDDMGLGELEQAGRSGLGKSHLV